MKAKRKKERETGRERRVEAKREIERWGEREES